MRKCDKCGCICDSGDLQGGICDDCREREQKQDERYGMILRMMWGEVRQMTLEDFEK